MPPEVEPAQPPMNVDSIRITGNAPGQCVKSSVKKPEVVCIDTAWNSDKPEGVARIAIGPAQPQHRKVDRDRQRQHRSSRRGTPGRESSC